LINPLAFVKSVTIVEQATAPEILQTDHLLDVASFIGAIPYLYDWETIYNVYPASKFDQTIIKGNGNCSNLVFGTAYELDRTGIDYEIIHLLPRTTVLNGEGHVVLRVPYRFQGAQRIGIIDVQAAGLPQSQGRFVDRKDLETGPLPEYTLLLLNPGRDHSNSNYYTDFLETAHVGSMPAKEVRRYFRFIESVYVPLGNVELEKYLFDGLAILLGVYPSIYVTSLSSLFEDVHLQRDFFLFALLMMRSLPIFILLFVLSKIMLSRRSG
jgi:hypothetical protein